MSDILTVASVTKRFRGLVAVNNVSFAVPQGEIIALIGPNGAGKTTMFNLIAGEFRPDEGTIEFAGSAIAGRSPDQVCRLGIGRTFQIVRPFPTLSVLDNVIVGALLRQSDVTAARERARDVLKRLHLDGKERLPASALTLPDRKRLEVARALATEPQLLLLDEVMAGLRPAEADEMVRILKDLNRDTGITVLLIEHVMRAVMALARRIVVLHHGAVIAEGEPSEVVRNPDVIKSYLGAEALG
jgi:branched-chain amino acid transport system ATP-binding protein